MILFFLQSLNLVKTIKPNRNYQFQIFRFLFYMISISVSKVKTEYTPNDILELFSLFLSPPPLNGTIMQLLIFITFLCFTKIWLRPHFKSDPKFGLFMHIFFFLHQVDVKVVLKKKNLPTSSQDAVTQADHQFNHILTLISFFDCGINI